MWLRLAAHRIRGSIIRTKASKCPPKSQMLMRKCDTYLASNHSPLPVILDKGRGVYVYDVDGKEYLDFLAGNGSVSVGHCHPKLYKAVAAQMKKLTLSPRAYYSKALAVYAEHMAQLFCYDKMLPLSLGCEATETAIMIARKWGYKVKGVTSNRAKVIFPENNYWGSSLAAVSASTDPEFSADLGPFVPGFDTVPFNNIDCLQEKLKDPEVCAFVVEPVQSAAGVIIPDMSYLKKARDLCSENNVLFVANEILCGLGRTGSLLCCDIYQTRPDILLLGKGLSGGIMPISAVFADKEVMNVLEPSSHYATFAGSPLSCRVASATLKIIQDEKLAENAKDMGLIFREELCDLPRDVISEVRGLGLLNAIVVNNDIDADEFCLELMKNGLLTQPPKKQIIRLTPPLNVKEKEILKASQIIRRCVNNVRPVETDKCNKCSRSTAPPKSTKKPKKRQRKPLPDC